MLIWTQNRQPYISTEEVLQLLGLKVWSPKFNILCKIAFFYLYKMTTLLSLEVNKAILEQAKVAE